MTVVASVGYFAVVGGGALLDRLAERSQETGGGWLRNFGGLIATERWVWITPIVVVAALYLSVMFQPGHADTGPVMYALF
jgi:hypothetical protein